MSATEEKLVKAWHGIAFSSILPSTCQASCKTDGRGCTVPQESFWSLVLTFIAKLSNHLVSRQNAMATDEEECECPYIISACRAETVQRAWGSNKQLACTGATKGWGKKGIQSQVCASKCLCCTLILKKYQKNPYHFQYSLEQHIGSLCYVTYLHCSCKYRMKL